MIVGVTVMGFIETLAPIVGLSIAYFLLFTAGCPSSEHRGNQEDKGTAVSCMGNHDHRTKE
jgi:hypothetical protein